MRFPKEQVKLIKTGNGYRGVGQELVLLDIARKSEAVDPVPNLKRSSFMRPDEKSASGARQAFAALWEVIEPNS